MDTYFKPSLKPLVEFCSIDGKINFFCRPGIAIQLNDPSGFIENLCKILDGEKTITELEHCLSPLFPNEISYLRKLLSVLDSEYLLEDSAYNSTKKLTDYDTIRWSRNIEFFGSYCSATENKYSHQEKLKATNVAIFGLGGVGSNILYNLVALGVCNIKIVDFDKVELSNLNRQIIFNESDIGQLKSSAAKNRVTEFFSGVNIEVINTKISSSTDIEEIITGVDVVITAIDHPREKIMDWFNLACIKQNTPFFCGSLDSRLVTYYGIVPGKTGCIECWKTTKEKNSFIFQELIKKKNFVASSSTNVAIMPFISLVAGFISNEFLKLITGISEPQSLGKLCTFDFISSQINVAESWVKNPICQICSKNYN